MIEMIEGPEEGPGPDLEAGLEVLEEGQEVDPSPTPGIIDVAGEKLEGIDVEALAQDPDLAEGVEAPVLEVEAAAAAIKDQDLEASVQEAEVLSENKIVKGQTKGQTKGQPIVGLGLNLPNLSFNVERGIS